MLAYKRQEVWKVPRKTKARRRHWLMRVLLCNRLVCVILVAAVVCLGLTVYVGAYARVVEKGYQRSDMLAQLTALKIENQDLRVELDGLRRPDRIVRLAAEMGMRPSTEMAYLNCPGSELWVAENTSDRR